MTIREERRRELLRKLDRERRDREEWQGDIDEAREQRDEAENALANAENEAFETLRLVRDWFDTVLLLKEPMRDPRLILREVERTLGL